MLLGSEVNILDAQGTVDLGQHTLSSMDVVIASLHTPCMKPASKLENTEAYLNVMKNPYVNIIGHPDDGRYEIDYEALVQGAKEYGKVLELNNHSMDSECTRENAVFSSLDAGFIHGVCRLAITTSILESVCCPRSTVPCASRIFTSDPNSN